MSFSSCTTAVYTAHVACLGLAFKASPLAGFKLDPSPQVPQPSYLDLSCHMDSSVEGVHLISREREGEGGRYRVKGVFSSADCIFKLNDNHYYSGGGALLVGDIPQIKLAEPGDESKTLLTALVSGQVLVSPDVSPNVLKVVWACYDQFGEWCEISHVKKP